jgi:FKBP12-rapamycin complex-associated protein
MTKKEKKKEKDVNNILQYLELSTQNNPSNYKAWHLYALLNYKYFEYTQKTRINYAINAIEGFTKSICIGGNNMSKILQDLLLLINIWFQIGNEEYIDKLMNEKIDIISIECWLLIIPQLLARINITNPLIRKTLILLLKKIGLKNPRSLTYPLTVLHNSKSKSRAEAVSLILEDIKKEHQQLFKECELIINELNRCALCLHEQWSENI